LVMPLGERPSTCLELSKEFVIIAHSVQSRHINDPPERRGRPGVSESPTDPARPRSLQ
jgi:hypothetical protein